MHRMFVKRVGTFLTYCNPHHSMLGKVADKMTGRRITLTGYFVSPAKYYPSTQPFCKENKKHGCQSQCLTHWKTITLPISS